MVIGIEVPTIYTVTVAKLQFVKYNFRITLCNERLARISKPDF